MSQLTLFRFIVLVAALASAIVFIHSAFNNNSFLVGEADSSSNFNYSVFSGIINSSSLGYRHANFDLNPATVCTEEQRSKISEQNVIGDRLNFNVGCFDSNWLDAFFAEEADIGTHEFVGISVGCNKGTDAVLAARMGMNDPAYDASTQQR